MPKMFQIVEDDLAELERTLPQLADDMMVKLNTRQKVQLRRVQSILSRIRWNYGPPLQASVIPTDGAENQTL